MSPTAVANLKLHETADPLRFGFRSVCSITS